MPEPSVWIIEVRSERDQGSTEYAEWVPLTLAGLFISFEEAHQQAQWLALHALAGVQYRATQYKRVAEER